MDDSLNDWISQSFNCFARHFPNKSVADLTRADTATHGQVEEVGVLVLQERVIGAGHIQNVTDRLHRFCLDEALQGGEGT